MENYADLKRRLSAKEECLDEDANRLRPFHKLWIPFRTHTQTKSFLRSHEQRNARPRRSNATLLLGKIASRTRNSTNLLRLGIFWMLSRFAFPRTSPESPWQEQRGLRHYGIPKSSIISHQTRTSRPSAIGSRGN